MSLATLNDNIKNRTFKRCYLLFGEEPFMIRHYKNALKNAVLGNGDKMNLSTFTGKVTDINSIIEIAETLPFFTDYRCILIENSGLFSSANELSEYIDKIPESTVPIRKVTYTLSPATAKTITAIYGSKFIHCIDTSPWLRECPLG